MEKRILKIADAEALPEKPLLGKPCNGCGYCCTVQPCALAIEHLQCTIGPCVALEVEGGRTFCGLVRHPLAHLFKATHPEAPINVADEPTHSVASQSLSAKFAQALGVDKGCDCEDPAPTDGTGCRR